MWIVYSNEQGLEGFYLDYCDALDAYEKAKKRFRTVCARRWRVLR